MYSNACELIISLHELLNIFTIAICFSNSLLVVHACMFCKSLLCLGVHAPKAYTYGSQFVYLCVCVSVCLYVCSYL